MKRIAILLLLVFVVFVPLQSNKKAKKKGNIDLAKEVYFNPKLAYKDAIEDIKSAGYRLQSIDTVGINNLKDFNYLFYRKIFGLVPKEVTIRTMNDTICMMYIYYDIQRAEDITTISNRITKIDKEFALESNRIDDAEFCGEEYEFASDITLRHESIIVYYPIDLGKSYLYIKIFTRNEMGSALEKAYESINNIGK